MFKSKDFPRDLGGNVWSEGGCQASDPRTGVVRFWFKGSLGKRNPLNTPHFANFLDFVYLKDKYQVELPKGWAHWYFKTSCIFYYRKKKFHIWKVHE